MGENKQFSSPNAYARNRRGRKAAGIISVICGSAIGVAILISFLLPSTGFVTKIDYQTKAEEAALLTLRGSRAGQGTALGGQGEGESGDPSTPGGQEGQRTSILKDQGLTEALPATASDILSFYEENKAAGTLDEAQLVPHSKDGQNAGILYTFFLNNSSETKDLGYNFSLSYSNYQAGKGGDFKGTSLYSYLRIIICIDEGEGADEQHYWFAMASSTQNAEGDAREAVSKFSRDVNGVRSALYADGDIFYCDTFDTENKVLGYVPNLKIKPGRETRFTVAVYLEGEDPDCKGEPNIGESLAINAEFSLN